jgi:hypothetical protein
MADAQVPWSVGALGGAVTDPAWRAKPSWYLVATEDRMIPPPAQPAPFWDYQHKRQAIARPGKSGAGRGCTQFGITRRPQAHRSASSGAAQPAMGAIRMQHIAAGLGALSMTCSVTQRDAAGRQSLSLHGFGELRDRADRRDLRDFCAS